MATNLMSLFERVKVWQRLLMLVVTAFAIFAAIAVESLDSLNEVLRDERGAKIRQLVESAERSGSACLNRIPRKISGL